MRASTLFVLVGAPLVVILATIQALNERDSKALQQAYPDIQAAPTSRFNLVTPLRP